MVNPSPSSDQKQLSDEEKAERRARNAAKRAKREAKAAARAAEMAANETPAVQKADTADAASETAKGDKTKKDSKGSKKKSAKTSKTAKAAPEGKRKKAAKSEKSAKAPAFNILIVAQAGRLEFEAVLFAATLRTNAPNWKGDLIVAVPEPRGAWEGHETMISDDCRKILTKLGATIRTFEAKHFGHAYPYGNKIEALATLPAGVPFVFFDTDTLITGPIDQIAFDFNRPAASMRREGTWPKPPLYGPGYAAIWQSLYDRFGLNFESSLDMSQPDEHWERYLYFNAGWFFGADPARFGARFLEWAVAVRNDPGEALAAQELNPWLDQVILPLVINSEGGGRPGPELAGLDGDMTCHYRNLPLLYARESDATIATVDAAARDKTLKPFLRGWEPVRKLIYQGKGMDKIRPLFDREHLPSREHPVRQAIKKAGWWLI